MILRPNNGESLKVLVRRFSLDEIITLLLLSRKRFIFLEVRRVSILIIRYENVWVIFVHSILIILSGVHSSLQGRELMGEGVIVLH